MDLKSTMHKPLGSYLKARRIAAGLTQHDVSTKLGYTTPQFVSNFERGLCSPPLNALAVLVKLYGMDPEELIDLILRYQEQLLRQTLLGEKKRTVRRARKAN
ncbi:MAG: helix-turn-helix transcriptional regulator [Bdellovibrionaceae bacterium]|nr:helix-turn-helix transcriptional regulator [Bdellovibrionales bacterium]MCB9085074.1 helix-turn-helix transcriptional regulator [Pseudobdellovibrionaceae bacterium]